MCHIIVIIIIIIKKILRFLKEALTPVKKNQTKCNVEEKEEIELSAFDKVLLECDQEGPVKFTEFLDSRYVASTVTANWAILKLNGTGLVGKIFGSKSCQTYTNRMSSLSKLNMKHVFSYPVQPTCNSSNKHNIFITRY